MNHDLARELNRRANADQDIRINHRPPATNKAAYAAWQGELQAIDSANTLWLKKTVERYGWPTRSQVGTEASHAAWLLVQHADHDPEFQRRCLDLMLAAADNEVSKQEIAYLTDRIRMNAGQPQVYGSQYIPDPNDPNRWIPYFLDDPAGVDARRATMGLPTLQENIDEINANHAYGTKASSLKRHRDTL